MTVDKNRATQEVLPWFTCICQGWCV